MYMSPYAEDWDRERRYGYGRVIYVLFLGIWQKG